MSAPTDRSAGCGRPAITDGQLSIAVDGLARGYYLQLPRNYDTNHAYPVAFGFHGTGGTGQRFSQGNMFATAIGDAAIRAFPDATVSPKSGRTTWFHDPWRDLKFFDALLAHLNQSTCMNPGRIFVAGHSAGALFVNGLGCQRGDRVRMIVPVEGGLYGLFGTPPELMKNCLGHPAVYIVHGTYDTTAPIAQGIATRDFWVTRNGCNPNQSTEVPHCQANAGCAAGGDVRWCQHDERPGGTNHASPGWAIPEAWALFAATP